MRRTAPEEDCSAALFNKASRERDPADPLAQIPPLLHHIADLEQAAWSDLLQA